MTSVREAMGKPVILRDRAEQVGEVRFFAIDGVERQTTAIVVASGRSTRVVEWAQVRNVGPDAVIVEDSREPTPDADRAASGALSPIDKRLLTDLGNELGTVVDVEIDEGGAVQQIVVGDDRLEGTRLRGLGSYALVIEGDPGEA